MGTHLLDTVVVGCALALLAGGLVKGVVGLGLPLVALPLLTLSVSLRQGVALLVVPLIASNLLQSFQGGLFLVVVRRFWPVLITLFVSVAISTQALRAFPQETLYIFIGASLIVLPTIAHLNPQLKIRPDQERWLGPLLGVAAGVLGGVSTFYGTLLMLYMIGLRLPKDEFVPAVSLLFFVGGLGLAIGVFALGVSHASQLGLSALSCIPVFFGLWLGQRVRIGLDERRFARVLLGVYWATGLSFLAKAL
jgi:uncharacterized membrane protein YfcA